MDSQLPYVQRRVIRPVPQVDLKILRRQSEGRPERFWEGEDGRKMERKSTKDFFRGPI